MSEVYSATTGWTAHVNPEDISLLAPAIVKAQGQIEGATKGKRNDHFRSKYADLGSCWDACREALQANDLAVIQLPTQAPPGHIGLVTTIMHKSGQYISEKFFMPLKDPTNPQAAGSALTYARRYALCAAIGICPVDDDANAAAGPQKATPKAESVDHHSYMASARANFAAVKDIKGKKEVFTTVRNGVLPEPYKTELLTEFAAAIKKESKNG